MAQQNRKYIVIGILAYLIFVLLMFPVKQIYQLLPKIPLPIEIVALNGTIWDAQAVVKTNQIGQVSVNWQLQAMPMLLGQLQTTWQVKSASANASGQANVSIGGVLTMTDTQLYIQPNIINQVLRAQRVSMAGDIELNVSNLVFDLNSKQTEMAEGRLIWNGGEVSYPNAGKTKQANLPIMVATLKSQDGQLFADVNTSEGLLVAQGSLKPDGWASVAILKRLLDLLGESWPNKVSDDTRILEVSEKIF